MFKLRDRFNHELDNDDRRILRGLSVERSIRSLGALDVNAETIDALRRQAPADPAAAADRFLLNLAKKSSESGLMTHLNIDMARGMAFTDALDSVYANLDFLKAEGWVDYYGDRHKEPETCFRLTLPGWRQVRKLQTEAHGSDTGFVAMPFREEFDALFEAAIRPAIEGAGWRTVRADKEHHSDRIDDWIMNQISGSRFVVVDTTEENAGALFEAGFALGLNRPTIWTVEKGDMESGLHFDIRQFNHLTWTRGHESALANPLRERIVATVGRGPNPPRSNQSLKATSLGSAR